MGVQVYAHTDLVGYVDSTDLVTQGFEGSSLYNIEFIFSSEDSVWRP